MPCQYVPKNQWTDKTPPVRQFFSPKILCNQMISRLFQSKKSCSRRPPSVTTRPQKSDKIKQDVSYPLLFLTPAIIPTPKGVLFYPCTPCH